jgi:hypothetical protein
MRKAYARKITARPDRDHRMLVAIGVEQRTSSTSLDVPYRPFYLVVDSPPDPLRITTTKCRLK